MSFTGAIQPLPKNRLKDVINKVQRRAQNRRYIKNIDRQNELRKMYERED